MVERLRAGVRELPGARIVRLRGDLDDFLATTLVTGGLDALHAEVVAAGADARDAANVLTNQFVAAGVDPASASPVELAKLVAARADIPRASFDEALAKSGEPGFSADPYLEQRAVADTSELDPVIDRVLEANPGQVAAFRGGQEGLLGFFVGQVMKETGGKANARVVNERLREKLAAS
jgi:aspartyl-tRNA(Asn)/glutamyl-tRNA(Gln) amidotransferase subunit B